MMNDMDPKDIDPKDITDITHSTVYFEGFAEQNADDYNMADKVGTITHLEMFFKYFNSIFNEKCFARLIFGKTIHFMKDDIGPVWENDENGNGGIITFIWKNYDEEQLKSCIMDLLLIFIGRTLDEELKVNEPSDYCTGVSISKRKFKILVRVWNHRKSNEAHLLPSILKLISPENRKISEKSKNKRGVKRNNRNNRNVVEHYYKANLDKTYFSKKNIVAKKPAKYGSTVT